MTTPTAEQALSELHAAVCELGPPRPGETAAAMVRRRAAELRELEAMRARYYGIPAELRRAAEGR